MNTYITIQPKKSRAALALTLIVLVSLFITSSCDSGDNGNNSDENFCYLVSSLNPCFDPNQGGTTTIVTDQTVEEVILEQESMEGFEEQLTLTNIFGGFKFGFTMPFCPFEQSALVIKTNREWNQYRNSCFFSTLDMPDIDFTNSMVLVSIQEFAQLGTTIFAILKFDDHMTVIIEDNVTSIAPPAPGNSIDIIAVPSRVMPVDFIRVDNDVTPFVSNFKSLH